MSSPDYFGRTWNLRVFIKASNETWEIANDGWQSEGLRVTFDIGQQATSAWWYGDISIYNLAPGQHEFIKKGDEVTLSAGYQSPGTNNRLIFKGQVYQPLWERTSAFDIRLTLHCLVGRLTDGNSEASVTIPADYTDEQAVRYLAGSVGINIAYLDPALGDEKSRKERPRGEPFSGNPRIYFDQIAAKHQINCWVDWDGLTIRPLAPLSDTPNRIYAPPLSPDSQIEAQPDAATSYTLIGSPQQTQMGVAFRTLLDSQLRLGDLIKLDFATIRMLQLGPFDIPRLFDKDGVFLSFNIRHLGDTRGQEWFTEVGAVVRAYSLMYAAIRL